MVVITTMCIDLKSQLQTIFIQNVGQDFIKYSIKYISLPMAWVVWRILYNEDIGSVD